MAYTSAELSALERAIAKGVLTVQYADRRVTYQSLAEMRKLRAEMKNEIDSAAGTPRARFIRISQTGRGY